MWQYFVVIIVLVLAVGYAAWRIRQNLRRTSDPCCGCNGCEGCKMKKQLCEKKKEQEKFCCSKNN
jgi:hypothetical protein